MSFQKWDKRAAKSAQKWANKCLQLNHDSPIGRWVKNFGSCGQNIFIATHKVPWYVKVFKRIQIYLKIEKKKYIYYIFDPGW